MANRALVPGIKKTKEMFMQKEASHNSFCIHIECTVTLVWVYFFF